MEAKEGVVDVLDAIERTYPTAAGVCQKPTENVGGTKDLCARVTREDCLEGAKGGHPWSGNPRTERKKLR